MQQLERDFEQEVQDLNTKYGPEKPRPQPMSSVSLSGQSGLKYFPDSNPRLFGTFPHLRSDSQSAPTSPMDSPIVIPRVTLSKSANRDSASLRQSSENVSNPRSSRNWN